MKLADIPTKFNIPFANAAGGGFIRPIPEASQIGTQAGAASLTDGFPPDTFLPIGAGGTPPWGADFNGLFNQDTAWARWQAAGGTCIHDAAFATAIGGYPLGAILKADTGAFFWQSIVDDNLTDPDAGGAGWVPMTANGPTRVITAAGAFVINDPDVSIGLARAPAGNSSTTLPAAASNGREIWIEDLLGSFDTNPVVVSAPVGQTIAGLPTWTCNVRRQCARFRFYDDVDTWSVKT